MVRDVVAMSGQELERVSVVSAVVEKRMRQRAAAERVGVTERQVKRWAARYRPAGPAGLAARWRGRRPNNAIAAATRREILELVEQRYADFPPTLAHEKLTQVHGYRLSVETLRQGLIEEGLWPPPARVRGRRDQPFAGVAVVGGGDNAGLHADPAGVPGAARAAGRIVLGPALDLAGQPAGPRGRVDAVHAGAADARHPAYSCQHAAGEGARGKGFSDPARALAAGVAAVRGLEDSNRGRQRLSAALQGGLQRALQPSAAE